MTLDENTLESMLKQAIAQIAQRNTRKFLPGLCDELGLPDSPDDFELSKREYVDSRLALVQSQDVSSLALRFVAMNPGTQASLELEELMWANGPAVPKKCRHELARVLEDTKHLYEAPASFVAGLERLWVLRAYGEALFDLVLGEDGFSSLARELHKHLVQNPGDWPTNFLFEQLGAYECSGKRFLMLLELMVSSEVQRDENAQRGLAATINAVIVPFGFELREVDTVDGYPLFRTSATQGVKGRPKNLVFASLSKPDLRLSDAIDNEIEIVSKLDDVLIYDQPFPATGLTWKDLQAWWSEKSGESGVSAKETLYRRLEASLPAKSPPQRTLFKKYFELHAPRIPQMPALLPEVWLHWDPRTVQERGAAALLRSRMDFLMLFSHEVRVVLEVDGQTHYSDNRGRASSALYARMARADRNLRLDGYEVYRFGATELTGDGAHQLLKDFFARLFRRHQLQKT